MSEKLHQRLVAANARMRARGYEMPEIHESEREDVSGLTFGQILRRKIARDIAK
jgi:hypothetical protein